MCSRESAVDLVLAKYSMTRNMRSLSATAELLVVHCECAALAHYVAALIRRLRMQQVKGQVYKMRLQVSRTACMALYRWMLRACQSG